MKIKLFIILFTQIWFNHMAPQTSLAICILSWKDTKTLTRTLNSYKKNGLLDYADEKIIFFNEIRKQDKKLAQKFNLEILGSAQNLGIAKPFLVLAQKAKSELLLLLEDDWKLVEKKEFINSHLTLIKNLFDKNQVDVVRLRHRKSPGQPLHSRWLKGQELKQPHHLLNCIHWHQSPEKIFSQYLTKINDTPGFFITKAPYANFTNNPCIYKRKWYIKTIKNFVEKNAFTLEKEVSKWWRHQDFVVGQGHGLFTHIRPYHKWN
jgi:hypothetical protein